MLYPTFCSSCGQRIGFAREKYASKTRLYCSAFCSHEAPLTIHEDRNDAWQYLDCRKVSRIRIAQIWGSPHSLVYKTMDRLGRPVDISREDMEE